VILLKINIFNFDLTGATIKIKFKLQVNSPVAFSWLTADGTISIIDAVNVGSKIVMLHQQHIF
jgi:hypothetical protein